LAGLAVALLACLGPAVVLGLNQASATPNIALKPLDLSPTCVNLGAPTTPVPTAQEGTPGRSLAQRMNCGGTEMIVRIEVFSPRSTAAPINAERRRLTRPKEADDVSEVPLTTRDGATLPPWRLIRANEPAYVAVAALWIDGKPAAPGMAMRLGMARTSVFGGADAPVVVAITPVADWARIDMRKKQELEHKLSDLLRAHPEIGAQIQAIAAAR
jgi:hypothetical protein